MTVGICLNLEFVLPDPATATDPQQLDELHALLERLERINANWEKTDCSTFRGDLSHLSDAVEHLEGLICVNRRIVACGPRSGEEWEI
jgi:hypothetical protein